MLLTVMTSGNWSVAKRVFHQTNHPDRQLMQSYNIRIDVDRKEHGHTQRAEKMILKSSDAEVTEGPCISSIESQQAEHY